MAFNPDAFIAKNKSFNPDAFIAKNKPQPKVETIPTKQEAVTLPPPQRSVMSAIINPKVQVQEPETELTDFKAIEQKILDEGEDQLTPDEELIYLKNRPKLSNEQPYYPDEINQPPYTAQPDNKETIVLNKQMPNPMLPMGGGSFAVKPKQVIENKNTNKAPWLMRAIAGGEDEAQAIMKSNLFRRSPNEANRLFPNDPVVKYLNNNPEQSFAPSMWNTKLDGQRANEVNQLALMSREDRKKYNESKGEITTGEYFGKKNDNREYMLFSGLLLFIKSKEYKESIGRLQSNKYDDGDNSPQKANDLLIIRDKIFAIEEMQDRGMSIPATITDAAANMAKYAGEIYLMGGLSGGSSGVTQLGKIGKGMQQATMNVGDLANLTTQRMTDKGVIGDKGEFIKTEDGQSLLKALPKSFVEQTATYWTEQQGEYIADGIKKIGGKVLAKLPQGISSVIIKSGKITKPFYDAVKKGGLDGMIPEMLEEYVDRVIKPILMADDQYRNKDDAYLTRVAESFIPDPRELLIQTVLFAALPIGGHIAGGIMGVGGRVINNTVTNNTDVTQNTPTKPIQDEVFGKGLGIGEKQAPQSTPAVQTPEVKGDSVGTEEKGLESKQGVSKGNVREEGYDTWYKTEEEAKRAMQSMKDNGLNPDMVSQAYHGDVIEYKVYRSRAEIDKLNKEYSAEVEAKQLEYQKQAKIALAEKNNIDGFASDLTPMKRGRVISTLSKKVNADGKITTVKDLVRDLVAKGETLSTREGDKIKPMSRTRYNRANNEEQEAHEKRVREAGKKTVYNVGGYDLGKTAYDYAEYLIAKKTSPATISPVQENEVARDNIAPQDTTEAGKGKITEVEGIEFPLNEDGTVTVYHRTNQTADQIKKTGWKTNEPGRIYVGNKSDGQISGYGENVVELRVKPEDLSIDDEFSDGEAHFVIKPQIANKALSSFNRPAPEDGGNKALTQEGEENFLADPTVEDNASGNAGFAGVSDRPVGKIKKPWLTPDKTTSPDTDIEDFFGRTKKMPPRIKASKLLDKIKAGIRERFLTATPHIDDTPEFAIARDIIRTMPEQRRQKVAQAVNDILVILNNDGTVQSLDATGLDLLRRKVFTQDLLHEATIDRSVSGGLTVEQLEAENARLDDLINKVPSVKKAFEARQKLWESVGNDLFERGVITEEAKENTSYIRHFVLDYIENNKTPISKKKKLSEPYRAYGKKRQGSRRDISTDYLAVEVKALADTYADNSIEDIANEIGKKYDKKKEFKAKAKETNVTIEIVAADNGYVEWHYKRPNLFYQAATLDQAKLAAIIENTAEEAGEMLQIPKSVMRSALVVGKRQGMFIPEGLAKQLDDLPVNKRSNFVVESFTKPMWQWWKRWILRVNPLRYNARNQIGDVERLNAAGQTDAIKKIPQAVKLLISKDSDLYKTMEEYGVAGSSFWHEMNDVSKIKDFEKFKNITKQKNFKSAIATVFGLPLRTISKAGQIEQDLTQFREDILRTAVFLNNLEKIKSGQKLRHWAGNLADIEAIAKDSPERAAAKVSRETMLDYGSFTPFENNVLRNGLIPFYSWFKRNATFWPRVLKNSSLEGEGSTVKKIIAGKVAWNMSKWVVRVLGIYGAAWMWNHKDEEMKKKEKSLPFWLRAMPHLNIGKKVIWAQTALADFVEWVDLPALSSVSWRHEAGFIDTKEAAIEAAKTIAKAPVEKFWQSLNPFIKAPITAITGQSTWPSVFNPSFVAKRASKKSVERAIIDILGADAKKFYQSAVADKRGNRKPLEETLYAYFAGWWMKPSDPEVLADEIKKSLEWSALKRESKTTGREAGEAKSGKEDQWQEAKYRQKILTGE